MKSRTLAASVLASAILVATSQAQLIPFFTRPSTLSQPKQDRQQHPIMDTNAPGIALPPSSDDKQPPPPQGDVVLSDVLGTQRQINVFAGFTRDIATVSTRLDASILNTTVLAPSNQAISSLPRKPWEDPKDYSEIGAKAYAGQDGSDRAQTNLKRFVEAHVVLASPWKESEKAKTMAGTEVWWENQDGKAVVQPGKVEVDRVVSRVANGEVWLLNSVLNYAS
jgi:hypothetical protein